jgi:glutathione S-transferase
MQTVLWHIEMSHFSEKARWALQIKDVEYERCGPPPGLHIVLALWLTRGRSGTLPILELDGEKLADSTAIIAALEERFPDPPLYPADPRKRMRALELEDYFDRELGPTIRRLVWHELRGDPERLGTIAARAAPVFSKWAATPYAHLLSAGTGLRYRANSEHAAQRATSMVLTVLDRLEAELGDREYLVGDQFSVADLTAASLLYPIVLPEQAPKQVREMPERYEQLRASLSSRRGYRWVEDIYATHRGESDSLADCTRASATPAR